MLGHGHGEGEEPVDGQVASQNPNHSNDPNNGGYLRVVPNLNRMTLEDAKQQITDCLLYTSIEKDIAKLADILGHSSINTTRIYIISTGNEHRRRMENMRLII